MKIGLLFPGQGAQVVGMGGQLVRRCSAAVGLFDRASELLGYDLLKLCVEGPAEQLNRTEFSQPALFVHSLAALAELESERLDIWDSVACVAGLSLGEYTAVAAAGGLDFEDGLRLVQLRGQAMQSAADAVASGMSSILGLGEDRLQAVCEQATGPEKFVRIANLLCPGNIAISGHLEALDVADKLSVEAGAFKAVRLPVAGAFHTSLMAPAVEQLQRALDEVGFRATKVPLFSNVDAKPHGQSDEFCELLARQVVSPVLWGKSLQGMIAEGCEQFIEIGAGKVLAGTLKRINRQVQCESIS